MILTRTIHAIRGRPISTEADRVVLFTWCEEWYGLPGTTPDDLDAPGLAAEIVFRGYVRVLRDVPPERWSPELHTRPLCQLCAEGLGLVLPDGYGV